MPTECRRLHFYEEAAVHDGGMARTQRPRTVTVWYRGIPYALNLVVCRRALVKCQVDGGIDSMHSLAIKVGISRSTASRFFAGRATSLAVTVRILHVLDLRFEDVAKPEPDRPDQEEKAGQNGK